MLGIIKIPVRFFYIGKGSRGRWKDVVNHRNQYFKNIISKEKNNVDVKNYLKIYMRMKVGN